MRFGLLDYYRAIEGCRRDTSEGQASFYWAIRDPQPVIDAETGRVIGQTAGNRRIHCSGVSLDRYYILSVSHPDVNISVLSTRFGRFIVHIHDPQGLLERIKGVWQKHDWFLENPAFIAPVEYNKDGLLGPDPCFMAPPHYCYSQKPESFREEREYRYVLNCGVDAKRAWPDYLTLMLADCSDICSAVEYRAPTSTMPLAPMP